MSLERKDFRGKLDPAWHDLMHAVAESEGKADGEWIEELVLRELRQRVHVANVVAEAAARVGISGIGRERRGKAGRAGS